MFLCSVTFFPFLSCNRKRYQVLFVFVYNILWKFEITLKYFLVIQTASENGRVVEDMDSAAQANQRRMNADPLEVMLLNMGYRITGLRGVGPDGSDDEDSSEGQVQCRPS